MSYRYLLVLFVSFSFHIVNFPSLKLYVSNFSVSQKETPFINVYKKLQSVFISTLPQTGGREKYYYMSVFSPMTFYKRLKNQQVVVLATWREDENLVEGRILRLQNSIYDFWGLGNLTFVPTFKVINIFGGHLKITQLSLVSLKLGHLHRPYSFIVVKGVSWQFIQRLDRPHKLFLTVEVTLSPPSHPRRETLLCDYTMDLLYKSRKVLCPILFTTCFLFINLTSFQIFISFNI